MSESKLINGIFFKKRENQPDFVVGKISINRKSFAEWIKANAKDDEWINGDILLSKGGKYYIQVDDWKPEKKEVANEGTEDLPF